MRLHTKIKDVVSLFRRMFQLRNVSLWPIMVSFLCYTLKCVLNKLRKIKNKIMHRSVQNSLKTIFYIVGEVSFIFLHQYMSAVLLPLLSFVVCDRSSAEVWHSNKCSEKSVSRRCTERLRQSKVRILMSVTLIQYVEFRCLCPDWSRSNSGTCMENLFVDTWI